MALSQEQINAILEGTGTYDESGADQLNDAEKSFFLSFSETAMEAGSEAVSQALGKTVKVQHPDLAVVSGETLIEELSNNQILISTGYVLDSNIDAVLLIKDYDVAVIFDILMGKDGRNPDLEISDLQISAIGEVMNQLVGSAATRLSAEFETKLAMIPPDSQQIDFSTSQLPAAYQGQSLLQTRYQLVIDGVLDSEIFEVRTLEKARQLYDSITGQNTQAEAAPAPPPPTEAPPPMAPPQMGSVPPPAATPDPAQHMYYAPAPQPAPAGPPVSVRSAEFAQLTPPGAVPVGNANLQRIMDIPLRVTVELGAAKLKVKNILDLAKGSVVELDKLSGEPVDLLVNGRLMARGEVVVINENFGVRIAEIVGPEARLQNLAE